VKKTEDVLLSVSWQHLTRWSSVKYAGLSSQGEFVPIAVESHGPINGDALQFLRKSGFWRLVETTGDVRASLFLFQRISVLMQRFNLALLHDGFIYDDRPK